ncbi:hypothetical protein MTP99_002608 [Tenebrio molitor]|jgi:hypothetical protein|uniref:uncharacterized protein n=1 Tax=Tenebrio molitor TaxID=7067 RepID=UPI00270E2F27|nr:hypothetical protein MTP99_002608 [Tenebrio molitor]
MSAPQKIVIPKGLVNPRETTIVEIPNNLKNVGTVVARPRTGNTTTTPSPSQFLRVPGPCRAGRTHPPKSKQIGAGYLHDAGITYAGRPYEEESPNESSHGFHPYYPKPPGYRYGSISKGDVSYTVGRYGGTGFDPDLIDASTPQDLDYSEGSLYRDFRPRRRSSNPNSPGCWPGPTSIQRYQFSDEYNSGQSPETSGSMPPYDYTQEYSPSQSRLYTSERAVDSTHNSSYYQYQPEEESEYSPSPSMQIPGAPRRRASYGGRGNRVGQPLSAAELMDSLGKIENRELNTIMNDVNRFQQARRKLVFDASSLQSSADLSKSMCDPNCCKVT